MGQQQQLLLVLVIIIVLAALIPIPFLFLSTASETNRDAVVNDLINLSAKAQKYYRTPTTLGGGGNSFNGFALSPLDTANANGYYSLTTTQPTDEAFVSGSVTPVSGSASLMYIVGCGVENGTNGNTPVKCYIEVTPKDSQVTILN